MSFTAEKHDAHKDECKHKATNYCKPCDEFYCLGCETTWSTAVACTQNHYPWWNYTCVGCSGANVSSPYVYPTITINDGLDVGSSSASVVMNDSENNSYTSPHINCVKF